MNSYCASVCSSSEYQDALSKFKWKSGPKAGMSYSIDDVDPDTGKSHNDIAQLMHDSYSKLRSQFTDIQSGWKDLKGRARRLQKQKVRQFRKAAVNDSNDAGGLHLSWMTIIMGIAVFLISGPVGFAVCVLCCIFEHYLEKDLEGDQVTMTAIGAV